MKEKLRKVRVLLGKRSYSIEIGNGLLDRAGEFLPRHGTFHRTIVVTDSNVEPLYAKRVLQSLVEGADGLASSVLAVLPAGEASKSIEAVEALWKILLENGVGRDSVILTLGGGVIGDLAGFVAATYARGIPYFQIPTSLLAMVDSSVGGKTGIDLDEGKNMVGAFHQPLGVLIDPEALQTLSEREYRAGLGEVVKYGVSLDTYFFDYLESHVEELNRREMSALNEVIVRCCQMKAEIVRADERETSGIRALLNYGHTFAHAFEVAGGYSALLHGEAVALGLLAAARLAHRLAKTRQEFKSITSSLVRRQERLFAAFGFPVTLPQEIIDGKFYPTPSGRNRKPLQPSDLLDLMKRDKKIQRGGIRFVLPIQLGQSGLFADIPEGPVRQELAAWLK